MKKNIIAITLIIFCLLMAGCGNEVKEKNNSEPSTNEITQPDKSGELKLSLEYNPKTDSPCGYDWGCMTESENGYFFYDNVWTTYWDKESGLYLPLCSNPDCEHDTAECVAFGVKKDVILSMSLYYYDGYIYKVGKESSKDGCYVNLYRIKEDGSEFEKYFSFFKAEDSNNARPPELCFHRGYVYYEIPFQSSMKLQRIRLGEEKSEVVYEMSGERQELYRIKAYGNHVFFQAGNFVDDKLTDINAGIYEYDITTNEVKQVLDGAIREYGIYENSLYYYKDNGINVLNFSDMSSERLIDGISNNRTIIFSKEAMTIYDENIVQIFGYDGKKIVEIPENNVIDIEGFSNNILFGHTSNNKVYYDITSDDKEWKVLKYGN